MCYQTQIPFIFVIFFQTLASFADRPLLTERPVSPTAHSETSAIDTKIHSRRAIVMLKIFIEGFLTKFIQRLERLSRCLTKPQVVVPSNGIYILFHVQYEKWVLYWWHFPVRALAKARAGQLHQKSKSTTEARRRRDCTEKGAENCGVVLCFEQLTTFLCVHSVPGGSV